MSGTGTSIKKDLASCIKFNNTIPSLVPVIEAMSQIVNNYGVLTKIGLTGYNFMPECFIQFGESYKITEIIYNGSTSIQFYVPTYFKPGFYKIQVVNTTFFSNSVDYQIALF